MFAQLTGADVVFLVAVAGLVGALCGWAGGAGARLSFTMRLNRFESLLLQILNRSKGAAGQAAMQKQKEQLSKADAEAAALAAQLRAVPKRGRLASLGGMFGGNPIDLAEEQSFAEIEAEKERRKAGKA